MLPQSMLKRSGSLKSILSNLGNQNTNQLMELRRAFPAVTQNQSGPEEFFKSEPIKEFVKYLKSIKEGTEETNKQLKSMLDFEQKEKKADDFWEESQEEKRIRREEKNNRLLGEMVKNLGFFSKLKGKMSSIGENFSLIGSGGILSALGNVAGKGGAAGVGASMFGLGAAGGGLMSKIISLAIKPATLAFAGYTGHEIGTIINNLIPDSLKKPVVDSTENLFSWANTPRFKDARKTPIQSLLRLAGWGESVDEILDKLSKPGEARIARALSQPPIRTAIPTVFDVGTLSPYDSSVAGATIDIGTQPSSQQFTLPDPIITSRTHPLVDKARKLYGHNNKSGGYCARGVQKIGSAAGLWPDAPRGDAWQWGSGLSNFGAKEIYKAEAGEIDAEKIRNLPPGSIIVWGSGTREAGGHGHVAIVGYDGVEYSDHKGTLANSLKTAREKGRDVRVFSVDSFLDTTNAASSANEQMVDNLIKNSVTSKHLYGENLRGNNVVNQTNISNPQPETDNMITSNLEGNYNRDSSAN